MAELHRVEINEKAPQEIDPESEEAVEAVPEEQTDRPEWLPEKFKSAEDMAKAYSELEKGSLTFSPFFSIKKSGRSIKLI